MPADCFLTSQPKHIAHEMKVSLEEIAMIRSETGLMI